MSSDLTQLSRRERQIMEVIYRLGEATAVQIAAALADAPSNSAIRTHLRILEEKGYLKHRRDGLSFVFIPKEAPKKASRTALNRVVQTFFEGSLAKAVAALVDSDAAKLTAEDIEYLESMIQAAKTQNR